MPSSDLVYNFFAFLQFLDDVFWSYIGLTLILCIGFYLTFKSRFFQLKILLRPKIHIKDLITCASNEKAGTHPIKLYFASIGGMVGLGNVVAVVATLTHGGPGSLVWLWVASVLGMLVKYSEIYLGIKYRIKNNKGGYDGGPMYYLKAAFNSQVLPIIICILLCIYGAEVSNFLILTDTLTDVFSLNRYLAIGLLLVLVLVSAVGGVKRLAHICSAVMPPFMIIYIVLGTWVIIDHASNLPGILYEVITSAFSLSSQITGFAGGGILLAAHWGLSRAVYSGDIGIGYDSIIQSETQTQHP